MQRLYYPTETVLSNKITRNRIFLSFKDSFINPLVRRPNVFPPSSKQNWTKLNHNLFTHLKTSSSFAVGPQVTRELWTILAQDMKSRRLLPSFWGFSMFLNRSFIPSSSYQIRILRMTHWHYKHSCCWQKVVTGLLYQQCKNIPARFWEWLAEIMGQNAMAGGGTLANMPAQRAAWHFNIITWEIRFPN